MGDPSWGAVDSDSKQGDNVPWWKKYKIGGDEGDDRGRVNESGVGVEEGVEGKGGCCSRVNCTSGGVGGFNRT